MGHHANSLHRLSSPSPQLSIFTLWYVGVHGRYGASINISRTSNLVAVIFAPERVRRVWWVCLFVHLLDTAELHQFLYMLPIWPCLGPPLATLRYVMYFRFCGWRNTDFTESSVMYIHKRWQKMTSITAGEIPAMITTSKYRPTHCELRTGGEVWRNTCETFSSQRVK